MNKKVLILILVIFFTLGAWGVYTIFTEKNEYNFIDAISVPTPNYLLDGSDSIEPDDSSHIAGATIETVGNPAYAYVVWEDQKWLYMPDVNQPLQRNIIKTMPGSMYISGDFVGNDYTKMYVISYPFDALDTINVATGNTTRLGKMAMYTLTGGWTGLAGTSSGILYATSVDGYSSYLYTVNITNGATTYIGKICDNCTIIDIAITDYNVMYAVDIHANVLYNINTISATGRVIGALGFDPNNAQDMDYDNTSKKLYLASYNNVTKCGEMRIADTNTGMTTLVGAFPDCDEVSGFSFLAPIPTIPVYQPIILKDK